MVFQSQCLFLFMVFFVLLITRKVRRLPDIIYQMDHMEKEIDLGHDSILKEVLMPAGEEKSSLCHIIPGSFIFDLSPLSLSLSLTHRHNTRYIHVSHYYYVTTHSFHTTAHITQHILHTNTIHYSPNNNNKHSSSSL